MGTTLTAAALVNEDDRDVIALVNVGDSRSYRFHDGGLGPDHRRPQPGRGDGPQRRAQRVRGRRPPPSAHPDPRPRGRRRRGRRPVAHPAIAGRPVPPLQRRADQRARRPPDLRGPGAPCPIPRSPPTCWCGRPGPTGAATTSPSSSSTSWSARTTSRTWPPSAAVAPDFQSARPGTPPSAGREPEAPADADVEVAARPRAAQTEVPGPLAGPAQGPPRRRAGPPPHHLPDPDLRGDPGGHPLRRLLCRALVRHERLLRRRSTTTS